MKVGLDRCDEWRRVWIERRIQKLNRSPAETAGFYSFSGITAIHHRRFPSNMPHHLDDRAKIYTINIDANIPTNLYILRLQLTCQLTHDLINARTQYKQQRQQYIKSRKITQYLHMPILKGSLIQLHARSILRAESLFRLRAQ